jgi:GNAT superfamily N-acetyltransferase
MTDAVYRVTPDRFDDASGVLARAFFDYPMYEWLVPEGPHRLHNLRLWMRASLLWGEIVGETHAIGEQMRGVAIWVRPGLVDADVDPDGSRTEWNAVEEAVGRGGMRRFDLMIETQRPLRERYMTDRCWFLNLLGVDPAAQRTGTGSTLVGQMLARLDAQGASSFLETEKAANVPYYLKHGYEIVHQGVLPDGGPEFWCFLRQPNPNSRYN